MLDKRITFTKVRRRKWKMTKFVVFCGEKQTGFGKKWLFYFSFRIYLNCR